MYPAGLCALQSHLSANATKDVHGVMCPWEVWETSCLAMGKGQQNQSPILGLHLTSRRPCWLVRTITCPLRWKLYYYANSAKRNCIVLPTNMAAVSRGCKPRIRQDANPWSPKHWGGQILCPLSYQTLLSLTIELLTLKWPCSPKVLVIIVAQQDIEHLTGVSTLLHLHLAFGIGLFFSLKVLIFLLNVLRHSSTINSCRFSFSR